MTELDDDAYEPGDPKRSDFDGIPVEIGPTPKRVTYPIVRFPTSVTHWVCPDAPEEGTTHHMTFPHNRCRYCNRTSGELRSEQAQLYLDAVKRRARHRSGQ